MEGAGNRVSLEAEFDELCKYMYYIYIGVRCQVYTIDQLQAIKQALKPG